MSNSPQDDTTVIQRMLAAGSLALESTMRRLRRLRDEPPPREESAPSEPFAIDLDGLAIEDRSLESTAGRAASPRDTGGGYDPYNRGKLPKRR